VPRQHVGEIDVSQGKGIEQAGNGFVQTLNAAAQLPGVRIDRERFLRTALKRHCSPKEIDAAVATSPVEAGIPTHIIDRIAKASITYETTKVSGFSAAAGIPGGLALIGTIPADVAQYLGHILRIVQKQAYIYSWPDLFAEDDGLDEETQNLLILFVGVMFGTSAAQAGVQKVSVMVAGQVVKKLPQRALTQGTVYPLVKAVAVKLGVEMNKRIFAGGVAKTIPVAGAVLSGGLTLATFLPMAKRLQKHLSGLELAQPKTELIAVDPEAEASVVPSSRFVSSD